MQFDPPLIEATLVQRYKRFLADVRLPNGEELTVHCPNPGAMMGLNDPGNRVWISDSQNPKRKLQYTLELMEVASPNGTQTLVGINTMHPNKLAAAAIEAGHIPELSGYDSMRREVKYGENSRIDLLLEGEGRFPCYVEIKNVHLVRQPGLHEFPDCKTARGAKHLDEMANMVAQGARAVMLYVIQREDGDAFALANDMDPHYAQAFENALAIGVEALAIRCKVSPEEIIACDPVPVIVDTQELNKIRA
ncbi:MAG: DNA/RNA nuclease SfsA [Rhizobiaceae bacterium]